MKLDILPFEIQHYDEVISLWKSSEGVGLSSADSKESIEKYLLRNPGLSFIACVEGKIVGTILGGHDGHRGYIHHLAVIPKFRKSGIGAKLTEHCLNALKIEGIEKCHLFVFQDNIAAINFWANTGWEMRDDLFVMSMQ